MRTDIIIAGGGLAGAACAAALARAGRDVTVIEREAGPSHKICGEFLSTEAQSYLIELGFDVAGLGGEVIETLRVTRGKTTIETALPFRGIGISRRTLDEALLRHAQASGAKLRRGVAIRDVMTMPELALRMADGDVIHPKTLFLATGKHDLRGLRRRAASPKDFVGFKMYFDLKAGARMALAGRIELILFRRGYAGLQLVEHGIANLCLLVDRARLQAVGGQWSDLLEDLCLETPLLADLLHGATPRLDSPLTIYRVPYGFIHRPRPGDHPDIYRLGDQASVIPSFTGDGMAIALHSVAVAVSSCVRGGDAAAYHRQLAADLAGQIKRAGLMYNLVSGPATGRAVFPIIQAFPRLLSFAANLTRVPKDARLKLC
jgi:flavin-dependent dehydrogenase